MTLEELHTAEMRRAGSLQPLQFGQRWALLSDNRRLRFVAWRLAR